MSSRFDYVKYDKQANDLQARAKAAAIDCQKVIKAIRSEIGTSGAAQPDASIKKLSTRGRKYTDRATDALELTYAMMGKAIRDLQILRNGSAPLEEERGEK